ncbi:MAG: O-antigen ligase family protein [Patescibacteria group bacterium]|nr:O-antigen ligase family protein [Patescibacteria group bacterium]
MNMAEKIKIQPNENRVASWLVLAFLALLFIAACLAAPSYPWLLIVFFAAAIFLLLATKIEYGVYLMIFFLPAINWNFTFHSLVIPFVDLLGLTVFTAFVLRTVYRRLFDRARFSLRIPLFIPFILFFASITISNFLSEYISGNIWYSIRWILFFYLVYVTLPVNVINNERILKNSLISFMLSGLTVAMMGVVSLFQQDWQYTLVRTLPIQIFGIYPLGDNHNLVGEVLIVSLFFTQALKYWSRSITATRLLNILMIFQTLVLLGTFSRAAWVALGVGVILFLIFAQRAARGQLLVIMAFCLILLSPFSLYMYKLQSNFSIGGTSNESRLLMTEIAWNNFTLKPLFGWGTGQFENMMANDVRFIANYGAPLDSHGVWQKVLAENGVFGVVTFAGIFLSIVIIFFRSLRKYRAETALLLPIFLGGLCMFLIQFFNTSYYKGKLWLPVALGLCAINIVRKKFREAKKKS